MLDTPPAHVLHLLFAGFLSWAALKSFRGWSCWHPEHLGIGPLFATSLAGARINQFFPGKYELITSSGVRIGHKMDDQTVKAFINEAVFAD